MTQTNSPTEKKEARRQWFLRFDDYKYKFHIAYDERKYHDDIHVVEAKWRDMAEMLAVALKFYSNVETFPIPKIDQSRGSAIIVKHPDYFSVAKEALAEFSKLSGSDRTQNLGDE